VRPREREHLGDARGAVAVANPVIYVHWWSRRPLLTDSKGAVMAEGRRKPVVGPETRAPIEDAGPERGNRFAMGANIRIVHDQVKVAEIDSELGKRFEVHSDEPPNLGGDDEFPQPLHYVAAGIGF
jgi:hypothetical protein